MIMYKLVAVILSITTGDLIGEIEEVHPPMTVEKCLKEQASKAVQKPINGTITVYECRPVEIV